MYFELLCEDYKAFALLESGGVAAMPHKEDIDNIILYCSKQCVNLSNDDVMEFYVPLELTEDIDIVKELRIHVKIKGTKENVYSKGNGSIIMDADDFDDCQFGSCEISVECYSYNGRLLSHTLYPSIYHEMNHLYDIWIEKCRSGSIDRNVKEAKIANTFADVFDVQYDNNGKIINDNQNIRNYNINKALDSIIYRLFSRSERNALAASVMGDLISFDDKNNRTYSDIKMTKAYMVYMDLMRYYAILCDLTIGERAKVEKFLLDELFFNIRKNDVGEDGNVIDKKRNLRTTYTQFLNKTKLYLSKLKDQIYYVASHYYAK